MKFAMDDEPVAVGFIFDVSGSISSRLQQYLPAALEFFKNADSDDEFFLVEFQSALKLVVPVAKNAGEIDYPILMTQSKGLTALFDADQVVQLILVHRAQLDALIEVLLEHRFRVVIV